jgi:hypothetical protein
MEAVTVAGTKTVTETKKGIDSLLKEFIIKELDLGYDKRQNVLLSCNVDGCNRISYCSCDCNDSSW